jgi:hypothetical protein
MRVVNLGSRFKCSFSNRKGGELTTRTKRQMDGKARIDHAKLLVITTPAARLCSEIIILKADGAAVAWAMRVTSLRSSSCKNIR